MLGDLSPAEVKRIVRESFGSAPMPYIHDGQVRTRAMRIARSQGIFDRIRRELTVDEPIPVLAHSRFREFRATGNRQNYERLLQRRIRQIDLATMAVYLGERSAAPYLQDLLWAECESSWWTMPAHESPQGPIDLRVAMSGFRYAFICSLLPNRLDPEVRQRVVAEVRRRVLDEYLDPGRFYWWRTFSNNWNAVCHAGVGLAAMLLETDPDRLAEIIASILQGLPAFVSGFTADGGCSEGPSYWRYGFQWYVRLAAALHEFTAGRIDIMAGERIERICRYPLAMTIAPGQEMTFADCHPGYLDATTAILINRFHEIPELFGLCQRAADGGLAVGDPLDLLLVDERPRPGFSDGSDHYLPELGVVMVRSGAVTLGAKAGHNEEHHNHNDVGSFLLHRGRTYFLTDLGAPVYSRRTFSPQRYESIFCNSYGHSVPVVAGQMQGAGGSFFGSMAVEGLGGGGAKTVTIQMARAYDVPSLRGLTRTIELADGGGQVRLTDAFVLEGEPASVEEAFITTQPAEVGPDGASVKISSDADGSVTLRAAAGTDGTFAVAELTEQSAAECRAGELIRRIAFTPARLAPRMSLQFEIQTG